MSITMSNASIESDERDSLLSSNVDTSSITSGGSTSNRSFFGFGEETGSQLAGVTEEFASKVTDAINTYSDNVKTVIDKMETVEENQAFKGTEIETKLNEFIVAVKDVANSYLAKLQSAETQIINSVATAYQTQDSDVGGQLSSDATSLSDMSVSSSTGTEN